MKNIIYLILIALSLNSASLTLNEAKDNNQTFSILHIKDSASFVCKEQMREDFKDIIVCQFPQTITPQIKKNSKDLMITSRGNELYIEPKVYATLHTLDEDFLITKTVEHGYEKKVKHWVVLGFRKKTELFKTTDDVGINFDIEFHDKLLPYVGSLDLDGLPITKKADAVSMGRIREKYEKGDYLRVIEDSEKLLADNDEVYAQEAKLYKLRAMDKLAWESDKESTIDIDSLQETAQEWIEENPSSKHLPEVLMYKAKSYYKLGHTSKGDEYASILKDEFKTSEFNSLAQMYKADRIFQDRKRRAEALRIYKDVFYETKDIDIASLVASKLTDKYLKMGKVDSAESFYNKVIKANSPYIQKHKKEASVFAQQFADAKKFDIAININKLLLQKEEDKYRAGEISKDIAYHTELKGDKVVAFGLYKKYLKEYPTGKYRDFVKARLDKLLLDVDEQNLTKKMKNIDYILENYQNDPIYKKALIEKAQMLIERGDYKGVFALEDTLKANDGYKFLQFAAQNKITTDLKQDNCKSAIYLQREYNATVQTKYEEKFFSCLMRKALYKQALEIALKHERDLPLKDRLRWMYYTLKVYSKLDKNKKVILLGSDIEKLSKSLNTTRYNDIVYEKAEAYYNLQGYDELMLQEVEKAQKLFPNDIRNIDLFVKVLRYAKNRKNSVLVVDYAQKLIALQKRHKISDYSPMVEIDYVTALNRLKRYDRALKEDLKLLYVKLNDVQRANVLYLAGELSLKLSKTKEGRDFFIKCGEIVEDSSWQRLCAQSLELLDDEF